MHCGKLIVVGGFPETIELCELCECEIIGVIDEMSEGMVCGYPIIGTDNDIVEIYQKYPNVPVLIAVDLPATRVKLVSLYRQAGFSFAQLISPKAIISQSAKIGEGVVVQSFCNISTNVVIGDFTKVNTFANIMHDCTVESYCTIAPNAALMGRVQVGELSYIGANATIIQSNKVGKNVTVGAGAVVTEDVVDDLTVVGVPAKQI